MDLTFTRSRRLGILFIVAVAVGIPPASALAQPINDDCADAICVEDGVAFEGSTVGATGTDVSSCSFEDDLDVWHTYKPEFSGNVSITLCDSGYDTTLSVFDACGGNELPSGCDDDGCDPWETCEESK